MSIRSVCSALRLSETSLSSASLVTRRVKAARVASLGQDREFIPHAPAGKPVPDCLLALAAAVDSPGVHDVASGFDVDVQPLVGSLLIFEEKPV